MEIPRYFIEKTSRQFGAQGGAWARELPSIAEHCIEGWRLTDCAPVKELSINFVCMCTSSVHGDAVLKIQGPHPERYTEIEALEIFGGRNCCRILERDMERAAMLLQRVTPGTSLRALPDRDRQLSIGAEMIRRLPVPAAGARRIPTYSMWLSNADAMLAHTKSPRALIDLMEKAHEQYQAVAASGGPHLLLHGDLHHDNILQAGGAWLAIDPQGVIGPPVLEAGRFIQNHDMMDYRLMDWPEVERTVRTLAGLIRQPSILVLRALFVLHALSIVWDWEMNVQAEKLRDGVEQCRRILEAIAEG